MKVQDSTTLPSSWEDLFSVLVFHNSSQDASLDSKRQALLGLWASGSQGIVCPGYGLLVDGVDSRRYEQKHFILCYSPSFIAFLCPSYLRRCLISRSQQSHSLISLLVPFISFMYQTMYRALWHGSRSAVTSKLFKEEVPFLFMHACMHSRTLLRVYHGSRTVLEAMVTVANPWRWVGESLYFLFILGVYIWFLFELVFIPKH